MRRTFPADSKLLLAVALLGAGGPAQAHHSFGMFDMQKTVAYEGTVKDFQWTNPHVWIDIMTIDAAKRQAVPVAVECDAVAIMQRKGWSRAALSPGDKVSIVVHPLKNGNIGGSLVSAKVNGKQIGSTEFRPA